MKQLLSFVGIAAIAVSGCHRSSEKTGVEGPKPEPIRAKVVELKMSQIEVQDQVVGTVEPELKATVSSKVIGRVLERRAEPGMLVKKGEVLVRIAAPELKAALERAEAALENSKREAKRYQSLKNSGSVSQREIDRVETEMRMNQAERDRISSLLDDTTVLAPFTGRITRKHVYPGDLVQPGTPLCDIEDPARLQLAIHVGESLAHKLKLGDKFRLRIGSADLDLTGTVAELSPAADVGSRTFLVKLDLPKAGALMAGQFGRAFLPLGKKAAILVPEDSLLTRGQLTFVAVVDDSGVARLRIVRTGETTPDGVEILAGLSAGERILAAIPHDFHGGTPVELLP
jgi:RND family efflux transporter MFP subunit